MNTTVDGIHTEVDSPVHGYVIEERVARRLEERLDAAAFSWSFAGLKRIATFSDGEAVNGEVHDMLARLAQAGVQPVLVVSDRSYGKAWWARHHELGAHRVVLVGLDDDGNIDLLAQELLCPDRAVGAAWAAFRHTGESGLDLYEDLPPDRFWRVYGHWLALMLEHEASRALIAERYPSLLKPPVLDMNEGFIAQPSSNGRLRVYHPAIPFCDVAETARTAEGDVQFGGFFDLKEIRPVAARLFLRVARRRRIAAAIEELREHFGDLVSGVLTGVAVGFQPKAMTASGVERDLGNGAQDVLDLWPAEDMKRPPVFAVRQKTSVSCVPATGTFFVETIVSVRGLPQGESVLVAAITGDGKQPSWVEVRGRETATFPLHMEAGDDVAYVIRRATGDGDA